jgi:hypothetical protein
MLLIVTHVTAPGKIPQCTDFIYSLPEILLCICNEWAHMFWTIPHLIFWTYSKYLTVTLVVICSEFFLNFLCQIMWGGYWLALSIANKSLIFIFVLQPHCSESKTTYFSPSDIFWFLSRWFSAYDVIAKYFK